MKIIITGSSDGIGKSMAQAFARRGARLGLVARRRELLESLAAELRALGSPQVELESADVTASVRQREVLARLDEKLGGATHFVANAGVGGEAPPEEDGFELAHRCFGVNLTAAIDGLEFMKMRMLARGTGTLVGVSSVAGVRGLPTMAAYCASKAALTAYLESARMDLKPRGIRVLTIAPGFVRTEINRKGHATLPFLMPVERAGEAFARGVLRGKRLIVAPWQFRALIPLMRWMPAGLYEFLVPRLVARAAPARQIRVSS